MSAHTPGPWEYMPALPNDISPGIRGADGWYVCSVSEHCPPSLVEANARLIAAAPDLLAACDALWRAANAGVNGGIKRDDPYWWDQFERAITEAGDAIEKARSEQP